MKNVSSLFSRLTTSSRTSTTQRSEKGEKAEKSEKNEKGEKQDSSIPKARPEKGKNSATRDIHADSKPAAKSEKSGNAVKPGKHERKELKYGQDITGTQRTLLAAIDAEEARVNRLYTPVTRTAMGATYEFKSEKEAMAAMDAIMLNAAYSARQPAKPYSSLSSTTTTTSAQKSTAVPRIRQSGTQEDIERRVIEVVRDYCADTIRSDVTRHSLSMKEVRRMTQNRYSPEEVNSALHALARRGAILIDKENPGYVFLPVPPEVKAQDKTPRSTTSSSTSSDSTSESSTHAKMPDFFARMGSAERHFYERDSVAVLLHYLHEAPQYTSLRAQEPGNDMRHFSIPRSVLEQAARNEDPGFGIHPYLISKVVQLLEKEDICQPHDANAQELHFSATIFQLDDLRSKYSYEA